jgi:peptidoglycan/xylan/chitin deacetylase (PgdA/CDA1 family)
MSNDACTIVYYHYIRNAHRTPFPDIKGLSIADFASQLDWLQARFRIIDGETFERAALGRETLTEPTALLTFDDGFVDHYETAYLELRRRGIGGIFFVSDATVAVAPTLLNVHKTHFLLCAVGGRRLLSEVEQQLLSMSVDAATAGGAREGLYRYDEEPDVTVKRLLNYELSYDVTDRLLEELFWSHLGDPVEFARGLYLSADMIREMSRHGMMFGYHTRLHRVLSRLTREQQERELGDGVDVIRGLTGQRTVSFCYPYGLPHTYNRDTLDVLAHIGYSLAFNTVRQPATLPAPSRYELPRLDTRDVPKQPHAPAHA